MEEEKKTTMDSGLSCLVMLAAYYGIPMDKEIEGLNIEYSEDNIGLDELRVELLDQLIAGRNITEYRDGSYSRKFKAWYMVYYRNRHGRNGTHKGIAAKSRILRLASRPLLLD